MVYHPSVLAVKTFAACVDDHLVVHCSERYGLAVPASADWQVDLSHRECQVKVPKQLSQLTVKIRCHQSLITSAS